MHLASCPVLEVLSYLVNLVAASLCRITVSLPYILAVLLVGSGNDDGFILNGSLDKLVSRNNLVEQQTLHAKGIVLFLVDVIRSIHKPGTTGRSKLHIHVGSFLHIVLVQLRINP